MFACASGLWVLTCMQFLQGWLGVTQQAGLARSWTLIALGWMLVLSCMSTQRCTLQRSQTCSNARAWHAAQSGGTCCICSATCLSKSWHTVVVHQLCLCVLCLCVLCRCCCLFYKAAKEVQQGDIQQMAWWGRHLVLAVAASYMPLQQHATQSTDSRHLEDILIAM